MLCMLSTIPAVPVPRLRMLGKWGKQKQDGAVNCLDALTGDRSV